MSDTCTAVHGAELKAWLQGEWKTMAQSEASAQAPDTLEWHSEDAALIDQLFFGQPGEETLNFALTPRAPNGCGAEYGQVSTDYIEATVHYRLPVE